MSDNCYFEMNEVEANLENMMNSLEFANYQIATGNIFSADEPRDQASIEKMNDLTDAISDQLCDAMYNLRELQKIVDGSIEVLPEEELPEEIKKDQKKGHIFMHEVDCVDAITHLQGAEVISMGNIKFDGEDATGIIFKTKDGKKIELIHTMDTLLCSGAYE